MPPGPVIAIDRSPLAGRRATRAFREPCAGRGRQLGIERGLRIDAAREFVEEGLAPVGLGGLLARDLAEHRGFERGRRLERRHARSLAGEHGLEVGRHAGRWLETGQRAQRIGEGSSPRDEGVFRFHATRIHAPAPSLERSAR